MTARRASRRSRPDTGPGTFVTVPAVQLAHAKGLPLPAYQTAGAAGLDLVAAVPARKPTILAPGGRALVPTGFVLALPAGFEAQVRPRSGLAAKYGVTVLNSPGTIDSDYRGEVQVLLINHGDADFAIRRGERIAQLVVAPVIAARLEPVTGLDDTDRGKGGFGSTGSKTASAQPAGANGRGAKSKAVPRRAIGAKRSDRSADRSSPRTRTGRG